MCASKSFQHAKPDLICVHVGTQPPRLDFHTEHFGPVQSVELSFLPMPHGLLNTPLCGCGGGALRAIRARAKGGATYSGRRGIGWAWQPEGYSCTV